jgi:hypothetical protein
MRDELDETPLTAEEQALARRGEALIRAAVAQVQTPQTLRESIERARARAASASPPAGFWSLRRRLLAAAGAAAVLAGGAIAIEAGHDAATPPSLARVEAAAQLRGTAAAPASRGGTPPTLDAQVAPIAFPDWERSFGWTAVGRREDSIGDREVTTVFYRNAAGARIGYAIVSGDQLSPRWPGRTVVRDGKTYHVGRVGDRGLVAWNQQGHTCVLVASGSVPASRLVELAASRNV